MKYIKILFSVFFIVFLLISCSVKKEKITILKDEDIESQMIELYKEAYNEFLGGDTIYAAKKFNEAELIFPHFNVLYCSERYVFRCPICEDII